MTGSPTAAAMEAYAYPLLIKHLLYTPLSVSPEREIVYARHRRYSYRQFRERLGRLASGLKDLGVAHGQVVAVMDWDSHRYLECFFAVPMMGAVLHTVNIRLSPEQILYTINHAEDDWLLVHEDFLPLLAGIRERIERTVKIIVLTDEPGHDPSGGEGVVAEYESMVSGGDPDFQFGDFDETTRATTFYTTGTTGNPKGVHYSHRQIVLHTLAIGAGISASAEQGRFHRDDVYMPITPMFHVHAWGIPYVATMMGVKQVYPGRYAPDVLLGLIRDEGVTFSHCVPTILHMLLNHPDVERTDLSRWKVVIGGSALSRGQATEALARGIDVFSGYGMSETCPVLTLAQLDSSDLDGDQEQQITLRCRTGLPMPMVDLQIVDEAMQPVPAGIEATGEVVVRAPWLTRGYLKNPEGSDALWRGGYLHTGDLGHLDGRGSLQVTDRLKDVIKSGGEWISSLELEDIASQHEGVAEAAAVGVPDPRWGERPLLLIVRRPDAGATPSAESLREHIRERAEAGQISSYAVPEHIEFVESIAKTSVGKIDKKLIRASWRSDSQ